MIYEQLGRSADAKIELADLIEIINMLEERRRIEVERNNNNNDGNTNVDDGSKRILETNAPNGLYNEILKVLVPMVLVLMVLVLTAFVLMSIVLIALVLMATAPWILLVLVLVASTKLMDGIISTYR